jgi:hypothetical protein
VTVITALNCRQSINSNRQPRLRINDQPQLGLL